MYNKLQGPGDWNEEGSLLGTTLVLMESLALLLEASLIKEGDFIAAFTCCIAAVHSDVAASSLCILKARGQLGIENS